MTFFIRLFSTLLQHGDNLIIILSPHGDNIVFETVTVKVQLLIWHMWVGYVYSMNAVNNHSFSDNCQ